MKKARKLLISRAFKAGLSVEACAWVFECTEAEVHKAIREAIREVL